MKKTITFLMILLFAFSVSAKTTGFQLDDIQLRWNTSDIFGWNVTSSSTYSIIGLGGSGGGSSDGFWTLTGIYLYNNSGNLAVNQTKLNATIDARATGGDFTNVARTNESNTFTENQIMSVANITIANVDHFDAGPIMWNTYSISDDLIFNLSNVEGSNYVGFYTSGAFMTLYANPGPSNDYEMWTLSESQGADTDIVMYEGGTGHNRLWDSGSMRVGGGRSSLCSNLTTDVDCDTSATGADLVVQDDIWAGGVSNATSFGLHDSGKIEGNSTCTTIRSPDGTNNFHVCN